MRKKEKEKMSIKKKKEKYIYEKKRKKGSMCKNKIKQVNSPVL
jgi:hypothetical protein